MRATSSTLFARVNTGITENAGMENARWSKSDIGNRELRGEDNLSPSPSVPVNLESIPNRPRWTLSPSQSIPCRQILLPISLSSVALTTSGLPQTTISSTAVTPQQGAPSPRYYWKIYWEIRGSTAVLTAVIPRISQCSSLIGKPETDTHYWIQLLTKTYDTYFRSL